MNVLRHDHVADQQKLITRAYLIEDLQELIALARRAQQRETPVATPRNEVQMAMPVAAFERILQRDTVKPRTLCKRRKECGTRKFQCTTNGKFQPPSRVVVVTFAAGKRQAHLYA